MNCKKWYKMRSSLESGSKCDLLSIFINDTRMEHFVFTKDFLSGIILSNSADLTLRSWTKYFRFCLGFSRSFFCCFGKTPGSQYFVKFSLLKRCACGISKWNVLKIRCEIEMFTAISTSIHFRLIFILYPIPYSKAVFHFRDSCNVFLT